MNMRENMQQRMHGRAKEEEKNRETTEGRPGRGELKGRGQDSKMRQGKKEEERGCAAAKRVPLVADENGE